MGRHAGWITAACGLASEAEGQPPHILLFPEIHFDQEAFLARVKECVDTHGYCVIGVSEGIKNGDGKFLSETGLTDAFGHAQLGGVAPTVANLVKDRLGYKYHWAVADYLQRSARHLASAVDVEQAYALGQAAVRIALEGKNAIMPAIRRLQDAPYKWDIIEAPLKDVANVEKFMPREFITADGFHITDECRRYLSPLIQGEDYPPFVNGLPSYVQLDNHKVERKLPDFKL
jgi:6-phosphofructokinase 1